MTRVHMTGNLKTTTIDRYSLAQFDVAAKRKNEK